MHRLRITHLMPGIVALLACGPLSSPIQAGFFSNPIPTVTTSPGETVLHMELSGYDSFGFTDGKADAAFTGDSNTWTFTLPGSIDLAQFSGAYFRASLVLDDHASVDPALYRFTALADGNQVYDGPANLPHGGPSTQQFTNWVQRDYAVPGSLASIMTYTLLNTSDLPAQNLDWIGIDWIELHLIAVPEPSSVAMLATATLGIAGVSFARRRRTGR